MDERPLPAPTAETKPYWDMAREHKLGLPRCRSCGLSHFYPRPFCPHCGARELEWIETAGTGTVYTFTINRRAANPAMKERLPYAVAVVELAEGPRVLTNIVDSDLEQLAIGAAVEVVFERVSDEITLPQFRLRTGGGSR